MVFLSRLVPDTDMVLEKMLKVLHLDLQATEDSTGHDLSIYVTSKPTPTVAHFLQQSHTYSNKVTPPNNAIPYGSIIQMHESMGAIPTPNHHTSGLLVGHKIIKCHFQENRLN